MAHLGSFGASKAPKEEEWFTFIGEDFRLSPTLTSLNLFDFMIAASEIDETDQVKSNIAIKEYLTSVVHPEDHDRFWEHAKKHRQDVPDLLQLARDLSEVLSAVPTGKPSVSSAGQNNTHSSSKHALSPEETRAVDVLTEGGTVRADLGRAVFDAVAAREQAD
jgi:hypothetical protein